MDNHLAHSVQSSFKEVWLFTWRRMVSRYTFVLALLFGFGQTFIMMLFPLIDNLYFDMLEQQRYHSIQLLLFISTIVILLLLFMIMGGEYLKKTITTQLEMDVSAELADHAQRLPLETAQGMHSSDLVQRVTQDAQRTSGFLTLIADQLANQIVMFMLALSYIMWLSWKVGAALLVISPLLLVTSHLLRKKVTEIGLRIAEQESTVRQCQQDALHNIELVKVYSIEKWMENRYLGERKKLNQLYMIRFWWQQLVGLTSSTFIDFMVIATMIAVGWMALHGTMTIGALVAFSTLVWRLNNPLKTIAFLWTRVHGEIGSAARIFALTKSEKEPGTLREANPEYETDNAVSMRRIHFAYKDRPKLLEDFSLEVAAGTFIAIVGPSGSGKSTIAKIAAGLLLPSEGTVCICGRDVQQHAEWARQNVAYVPQLSYLFSGTVLDNLSMANPEANHEEIEYAVRLVHAHDFIHALPHQYETDLKEHGGSLSGGQRQRLAIARAIVANRPVWILDELTSALDIATEEKVMHNLIQLTKRHNRTMIVVAHRLSTIRNADQIVVVQNGRIIQTGKHEELVKGENGLYQQMWLNNQ